MSLEKQWLPVLLPSPLHLEVPAFLTFREQGQDFGAQRRRFGPQKRRFKILRRRLGYCLWFLLISQ